MRRNIKIVHVQNVSQLTAWHRSNVETDIERKEREKEKDIILGNSLAVRSKLEALRMTHVSIFYYHLLVINKRIRNTYILV